MCLGVKKLYTMRLAMAFCTDTRLRANKMVSWRSLRVKVNLTIVHFRIIGYSNSLTGSLIREV